MTVELAVPGRDPLRLDHVVLDVNGTITNRGELLEGVGAGLEGVRRLLEVHLLSADTFGTLSGIASELGAHASAVASGDEKVAYLRELGAERCAAIGNGANDEAMLEAAALGIAVVGPEGAAAGALRAADVVCTSILDALDLVVDERALVATLRA